MVFQVWHTTAHNTGITKMPDGEVLWHVHEPQKQLLTSACLTVRLCPSVWNNLAPTGQNFMEFYTRDLY